MKKITIYLNALDILHMLCLKLFIKFFEVILGLKYTVLWYIICILHCMVTAGVSDCGWQSPHFHHCAHCCSACKCDLRLNSVLL